MKQEYIHKHKENIKGEKNNQILEAGKHTVTDLETEKYKLRLVVNRRQRFTQKG